MQFFKTHRKPTIIISILAILFVISGLYIYNLSRNLAQEVANPIEQSLIRAGAVKKCSYGDTGHGPDNFDPWYRSYFEFAGENVAATALIEKSVSENGYSLNGPKDSSQTSVGYLGDQIFFGNTNIGDYNLTMALTNSGSLHACPDEGDIFNDNDHTAITIELRQ